MAKFALITGVLQGYCLDPRGFARLLPWSKGCCKVITLLQGVREGFCLDKRGVERLLPWSKRRQGYCLDQRRVARLLPWSKGWGNVIAFIKGILQGYCLDQRSEERLYCLWSKGCFKVIALIKWGCGTVVICIKGLFHANCFEPVWPGELPWSTVCGTAWVCSWRGPLWSRSCRTSRRSPRTSAPGLTEILE